MNALMLRRRAMMATTAEVWPRTIDAQMISNTIIDISNGQATRNFSWSATDYIAIPTGAARVRAMPTASSYGVYVRGAYYDANRALISTIGPVSTTNTFTLPANAAYLRYSYQTQNGDGSVEHIFYQ